MIKKENLYDVMVSRGHGFKKNETFHTVQEAINRKKHLYNTDKKIVGIYIRHRKNK